jgi:hypothetical protein
MSDFLSSVGRRQQDLLAAIQFNIASGLVILSFVLSPPAFAQSATPASAPSACPVQFLHFDPDGVSTRIRNVSGRKIVREQPSCRRDLDLIDVLGNYRQLVQPSPE